MLYLTTTSGGGFTNTITTSTSNVVYLNGNVAYPAPVVQEAVAKPAKPEAPEEWLRRRVAEVCWAPAA